MGHAKTYRRMGKKAIRTIDLLREKAPLLGLLGSLGMLASDDLAGDAWIPTAVGFAPTLLDEGIASGSALKGMIKAKGFLKGLIKSRSLVPAYASYLAPLAAMYGTSKLLDIGE